MNKNLKANRLTVKSFRGIKDELTIELRNVTIIKGENGTGKSSFVNALEYLFSKDLAFLKNKTINTNESAFNKNSNKKDAKIELKFRKKNVIKFENSKRANAQMFDDILKNTYVNKASFILNRKKLLQFIDGTQGDRYKAIMELCGIEGIDKIQSAFSSTQSTIAKDLNNVSDNYKNKLTELSQLVNGKNNLSYDECIKEINIKLKNNNKDIINENTDINEFISKIDLSDSIVVSNKIDEFIDISEKIDLESIEPNLKVIIDEYESIASDNLKSSQSLLKTLLASQNYIELTNVDKCPVCNNDIDPEEIVSEIKYKIDDLNSNNSILDDWKIKIRNLSSKLDAQIIYCKNLNDLINDLNNLLEDNLPNFNYNALINLKNDLKEFSEFNKVSTVFNNLNFDSMICDINSIKKCLLDYESSQNIDDLSNIYKMLFEIKELNELNSKINVLTKQRDVALKTFNTFTKTKEKFINEIISEIRYDVKVYYEYIHGNDLISAPDIKLSGSKLIDVYLNSFGELVDSRSYASEGHLDTLGICIFLAFNKKFNPLPLIVLDDVLTTIDLPHKERVGRLIVDKLVDNQFLITTHSPLWAEQLKRLCIDSKRDNIVYELIDWTFEEGPITSKPLDAEAKIHKYLSNEHKDFQAAGNAARRYLEYTLTQICLVNNVKVPINDKYDVGTLFDEAKNFSINVVSGTSLEPYYIHVWGELNKTRYIANLLSHYNEQSNQLPKNDVVKFCEDVINLNHAYKCDCGKSFLKLDSKSNKLICSSEKCRDAIDMNSFKDTDFGHVEEDEVEL